MFPSSSVGGLCLPLLVLIAVAAVAAVEASSSTARSLAPQQMRQETPEVVISTWVPYFHAHLRVFLACTKNIDLGHL